MIKPPAPDKPVKRLKFFEKNPSYPGAADEVLKIKYDLRLKELQRKFGRKNLSLGELELMDWQFKFHKENKKTRESGLLWVSRMFNWVGKIIGRFKNGKVKKVI